MTLALCVFAHSDLLTVACKHLITQNNVIRCS